MRKTHIRATVRLQLHADFTFAHAEQYVPYFASLGISHYYVSPIFAARQSSTHGYDVVDPTQVNAELGGEAALRSLVKVLRAHEMGLIVDIVPNHMGVGGSENPWWQHMLQWGRQSPYAFWFDIDWDSPDPQLHNKLLAPFLGEPYGEVLNNGQLSLDYVDGQIVARYFDTLFPIALKDYATILASSKNAALAKLAEQFGRLDYQAPFDEIAAGADKVQAALKLFSEQESGLQALRAAMQQISADHAQLHELLERQNYRLTWWRNAADEINWRRFFEVSELAGVRVELNEVFEATHAKLFQLYSQGIIDGVRLDHIDGLAHPQEYCLKLRARLKSLLKHRPKQLQQQPYIIAEKILAAGETLRKRWNLDGTTGYEFMDQVSALLHDPRGAAPLSNFWQSATQDQYDLARHVRSARYQLLAENLVGEFNSTAAALHRIARAQLMSRDFSLAAIKRVLTEILVHFPVYRSYIGKSGPDPTDRKLFAQVAASAVRTLGQVDKPLVNILLGWLSADLVKQDPDSELADLSQRAMTRFQQLMPPLCAKSMEDTAFYRFGRLLSRNEVGSDPDQFSLSPEAFHAACSQRLKDYPHNLLATATHDHKRGEDTRARIATLSQCAERWASLVAQWQLMNARFHINIHPEENQNVIYSAPRPSHEIMLYQTLVGAWPLDLAPDDKPGLKAYAERLDQWLIKSVREAKRLSGWMQANLDYEHACSRLLHSALDPELSQEFLQSVFAFVQDIAAAGAVNSLAQATLRLSTPGIPDLYQGSELWDFSLVDPDNRRPVDYALREQLLQGHLGVQGISIDDKLSDWRNGAIKQHLIHALLGHRQRHPALFSEGSYQPLTLSGPKAAQIFAFMREYQGHVLIVAVPRFSLSLLADSHQLKLSTTQCQHTLLHLPSQFNGEALDLFSGGQRHIYSGMIKLEEIFTSMPVAALALAPVS